jgi:hypothetical protein
MLLRTSAVSVCNTAAWRRLNPKASMRPRNRPCRWRTTARSSAREASPAIHGYTFSARPAWVIALIRRRGQLFSVFGGGALHPRTNEWVRRAERGRYGGCSPRPSDARDRRRCPPTLDASRLSSPTFSTRRFANHSASSDDLNGAVFGTGRTLQGLWVQIVGIAG